MIEQLQILLTDAFRQDSIYLYFLMFGGGILASLTPCTYPVLPLTAGYIGNQAGASRWKLFLLSLSLVTGLAAVYAVLGCIVAAVGGTFGSIMGNGLALYAIALFYLAMGLCLLDLFSLPNLRIFCLLQAKSTNRKGLAGAFLIGGISGLIVGPCTGPILAVALGAIALTLKTVQGADYLLQVVKGGVLLFLFGFGQGALILVVGVFAGFLSKLPRAGAWMNGIKKGSALLIIFTASLLFVFVGQNTDFPNLSQVLAGFYSAAAPETGQDAPAGLPPRSIEKPSLSDSPLPAASLPMPAATPLPRAMEKSPSGLPSPALPATKPAAPHESTPWAVEKPALPDPNPHALPAIKQTGPSEFPPQATEKPVSLAASPSPSPAAVKPMASAELPSQPMEKPMPAVSASSASTAAKPAPPAELPPKAMETPTAAVSALPAPAAAVRPAPSPLLPKAPDFTLASLDGLQVTLSSYKGKKGVVLVFFATWCVNCMKEVPEIKQFAQTARKDNVELLAINYKQYPNIVERFSKSNNINYSILLDTDGKVATGKFDVRGLPHIVGINAKGDIIYRGEALPGKKAEFIKELNQGL
jgi:cytochrome c-type biogenesis protein